MKIIGKVQKVVIGVIDAGGPAGAYLFPTSHYPAFSELEPLRVRQAVKALVDKGVIEKVGINYVRKGAAQ